VEIKILGFNLAFHCLRNISTGLRAQQEGDDRVLLVPVHTKPKNKHTVIPIHDVVYF
jgi:hypothetical protein